MELMCGWWRSRGGAGGRGGESVVYWRCGRCRWVKGGEFILPSPNKSGGGGAGAVEL